MASKIMPCTRDYNYWLAPVEDIADVTQASRDYAYITPDNKVWVLDYDGTALIPINGSGADFNVVSGGDPVMITRSGNTFTVNVDLSNVQQDIRNLSQTVTYNKITTDEKIDSNKRAADATQESLNELEAEVITNITGSPGVNITRNGKTVNIGVDTTSTVGKRLGMIAPLANFDNDYTINLGTIGAIGSAGAFQLPAGGYMLITSIAYTQLNFTSPQNLAFNYSGNRTVWVNEESGGSVFTASVFGTGIGTTAIGSWCVVSVGGVKTGILTINGIGEFKWDANGNPISIQ